MTIPIEFRRALGIQPNTLLDVWVEGDRLVFTPLWRDEASLREYTNEEVSRFLEEDRLSPEACQGPQS